jgi:hypothetical protein
MVAPPASQGCPSPGAWTAATNGRERSVAPSICGVTAVHDSFTARCDEPPQLTSQATAKSAVTARSKRGVKGR